MEMKQKLRFLSVIFAAIFLASCAGNEEVKGDDANNAATTSPVTQVAPVEQPEQVDQTAEMLKNMVKVYYFDFDQSTLTDQTRADLDNAAAVLKAANIAFRLEGHADERGTPEYNLALGERRAQAVASYLNSQGVDTSKAEIISYGEERPVMTGSDEASWAKNRRVELVW